MRYQLHFKSLSGLCVLSVLAATACSDDFPSSNSASDYLVTLDVTPDHHGVNEELTLTFAVTHEGEHVDGLTPEVRYTHLGNGDGHDHASTKTAHEGAGGHGGAGGHDGAAGHGGADHGHGGAGGHDGAAGHGGADHGHGGAGGHGGPGNHIEMMHGMQPGTYVGAHAFDEVGNYEIDFEFEGHDGMELHHFTLAIEDGEGHAH